MLQSPHEIALGNGRRRRLGVRSRCCWPERATRSRLPGAAARTSAAGRGRVRRGRGFGGGFGARGFGAGVGIGLGRHAAGLAAGIIVVLILLGLTLAAIVAFGAWRYSRVRRARVERVRLAALEAAENDPAFAPDVVDRETRALFSNIEQAWSADDRARLAQLVGPDLMVEWGRRLDDFARRGWHNEVEIMGEPQIEYVGLVNRGDDRDDHVVVRVTARMTDVVLDSYGNRLLRDGAASPLTTMCEYWTLGKRDGHWTLVSIEQRAEGDHELAEEIVATPWSDVDRLRDTSLVEQAVAERTPAGTDIGELAPAELSAEARATALDLSLVDGRFAPDVLIAAVRRAVQAWTDAVDGSDADLRRLASAPATRDLLHPGDDTERTRLVLRGARVRSVRIVAVDAHAQPPRMTVEIEVSARRYIQDRDTEAVLSGDQGHETTFRERWALDLDGDDEHPWRIVDAAAPAPA